MTTPATVVMKLEKKSANADLENTRRNVAKLKFQTINPGQTRKVAEILAKEIKKIPLIKNQTFVIGLQGNLGAGKTIFVKGFAKGLGIKELIKSSSFVIMRIFELGHNKKQHFNHLIHFDAYRISKLKEIAELGFNEIIKNPQNIVIIEWFEKVKKIIRIPCLKIEFKILKNNKRELTFSLTK